MCPACPPDAGLSSSTRSVMPSAMACMTGLGTRASRPGRGPSSLREFQPYRIASSGCAGRALHQQGRVAADCCGQASWNTHVRGAGHAKQEQGAVGGERRRRPRRCGAVPRTSRDPPCRPAACRPAEAATAEGDSRQRAGRGRSSCAASAVSSAAKACSACGSSASPAPRSRLRPGPRSRADGRSSVQRTQRARTRPAPLQLGPVRIWFHRAPRH